MDIGLATATGSGYVSFVIFDFSLLYFREPAMEPKAV